mmetsp:Transcript_4831/g.10222  ORF Transcript_4831/g.10222 Transcript_4831/m.10222 type:complete len:319 (-) Transcript_4831:38-994(-)
MEYFHEKVCAPQVRTGRPLYTRTFTRIGNGESTILCPFSLVFLHGACASSSSFMPLVEYILQCTGAPMLEKDTNPSAMLMSCHLFDAFGCGRSRSGALRWENFSAGELQADAEEFLRGAIRSGSSERREEKIVIVAHSFGTSQCVRILENLSDEERSAVGGVVLIGGNIDENFPAIFYLPTFVLRGLQPRLTSLFLSAAYQKKFLEEKPDRNQAAAKACNDNPMFFVKAFYMQNCWVRGREVADAFGRRGSLPVLVLHGADDGIVPVLAGGRLADAIRKENGCSTVKFIEINDGSHQVFEEKPKEVGDLILDFVSSFV